MYNCCSKSNKKHHVHQGPDVVKDVCVGWKKITNYSERTGRI